MCKIKKEITEGNARKFTVNFACFGYIDVIKCQEKPTISCERAEITTTRINSARAVIKLYGATLNLLHPTGKTDYRLFFDTNSRAGKEASKV